MSQEMFFERSEIDTTIDECLYLIERNSRLVRDRVFRETPRGDHTLMSQALANHAAFTYTREFGTTREADMSLDALMQLNTTPETFIRAAYAGASVGSDKARHALSMVLDHEATQLHDNQEKLQRQPTHRVSPLLWHAALQASEHGHTAQSFINRYSVDTVQGWDIDVHLAAQQRPEERDQSVIAERAKELLDGHEHSAVSVFNRTRSILPLIDDPELRREVAVRFFLGWRRMDFSDTALKVFIATSRMILKDQYPTDSDLYEHIQDNINSVSELLDAEGVDLFELEQILLPWRIAEAQYLGTPTNEVIDVLDTSTMGLLSLDIPDDSPANMRHNRTEVMGRRNSVLGELAATSAVNRAFHDAKRYIKAMSDYPSQERAFIQAFAQTETEKELQQLAPDDISVVLTPHLISLYNLHHARISQSVADVHDYANEIIGGCVQSDTWTERSYLGEAFKAAYVADKTLGLEVGRRILAIRRNADLPTHGLNAISAALIEHKDEDEVHHALASVRQSKMGAVRAIEAFRLLRMLEADS